MISLRKLGYSFLALLILSGLLSALIPQQASAQTVSDFGIPVVQNGSEKRADAKQSNFVVQWLDAAHIKLSSASNPSISFIATPDNEKGGQDPLYDQRNPGVQSDYSITSWPCDPSLSIAFDSQADEHTQVKTVTLEDMQFREGGLGDCLKTNVSSIEITALNPELSVAYFRRINATTIERADGLVTYINSQQYPNVYTEGGRTNACTNRLVADGDNVRYFAFGASTNDYSGNTPPEAQTSCRYRVDGDDTIHLDDDFIRNNFAMPLVPVNEEIEPGGGAGGSDAEQQASCETYGGGGGLSWVACPLINIADNTTSFLDSQVTSLLQVPKSDYDNPELKQTWERIRNVALIILVPIMLVMVISTALGFSFVDAYTIKKALPRLVVAVMFIVLSWWITIFFLDLTNDVGKGILGLMTNAFGGPDSLTLRSLFDPNALEGLAGAGAAGAGAGIFLWILITGGGLGIVLSFGFTTLLALFIVFMVLTIRQMLLVALTLFAPLAILAWIFPNNDKLWKLWWETFSKLLLMFPIIMIIIASGRIFAAVIGSTGGTLVNTLLKLIAYIAPYFFIPATFKIAGGLFATLSGVVNDRGKGLFDRNKKYRQHAGSQAWERSGGRRILQARAGASRALQDRASRSGRVGGFISRRAASAVGGYNVEAAASAKQAQVSKELNDQIATGRDDAIRGLTVNRAAVTAANTAIKVKDANGNYVWDRDSEAADVLARVDEKGKRQYKSLGGAWVDEASVIEGQSRWGKDTAAQQTALSYEMRKAMKSEQVQGVSDRYIGLAKDQWGMSDTETRGAWIGSGFENQNQHLEFKNTDLDLTNRRASLNRQKFIDETFEKKGSYPLAQMSGHTIEQLSNAFTNDAAVINQSQTVIENISAVPEASRSAQQQQELRVATAARDQAVDRQTKVKEISEVFVQRGFSGQQGMADGEVPIFQPQIGAVGGQAAAQVSAPGSAAVQQEVERLARLTGAMPAPGPTQPRQPGPPPAGTYRDEDGNIRQSGGPGGGGFILPR